MVEALGANGYVSRASSPGVAGPRTRISRATVRMPPPRARSSTNRRHLADGRHRPRLFLTRRVDDNTASRSAGACCNDGLRPPRIQALSTDSRHRAGRHRPTGDAR